MPCKNCGAPPVSAIETKLQLCITCIEKRAGEHESLVAAQDALKAEVTKLTEELAAHKSKVETFEHLMHAERAGQTSADNGLAEDQNPFQVGSDAHVMWLAGWTAVDTRRSGLQAHAVMTWSVATLESIVELAKGYDQQEIADKLEVVLSKYRNFV